MSNYKKVNKLYGVYYYESKSKKFKGQADCCFYIRYRDGYGKQHWEKIGWKSEGYNAKAASGILNDRLQTSRHGDTPEIQKKRKKLTFDVLWEHYQDWIEANKVSYKDDVFRYHKHLEEKFKKVPLDSITPLMLENLKKDLFAKELSPATVKHCLVLVRQMFNKAKSWNMWNGNNPVQKIKMPQVQNRRERFLSMEEASRLVERLGLRSTQTQRIAVVSLETGMRAGEIFDMRWQDLDMNAGVINVRGKGGFDRKVYMTDTVKYIFDNQKRGESGYVFESRTGGRINKVSNAFERAVKDLGLNDVVTDRKQMVTFHTLRHTFASWLAMEGVPLFTIKELMGHRTIEMTMRYSHLMPDQKQSAVNLISSKWS